MRPLKGSDARFPVEADAIELLRATQRYEPPPGQKQRVTARLLSERAATRRGRWVGAPLVVALSLCAAGASAAVSGGWVTRGYELLTESLAPSPPAPASAAKKGSARHFAPQHPRPTPPSALALPLPAVAEESGPELTAPLPRTPAPHVSGATGRSHASARAIDAAPVAANDVSASKATPPPNDEATRSRNNATSASEASNLVVSAMRALRQDRQPERAAALLDEYMRRYPSGALAEEALALSVEAATQRGDARAADLAERYLSRYPSGQFRRAAERARALFSK